MEVGDITVLKIEGLHFPLVLVFISTWKVLNSKEHSEYSQEIWKRLA